MIRQRNKAEFVFGARDFSPVNHGEFNRDFRLRPLGFAETRKSRAPMKFMPSNPNLSRCADFLKLVLNINENTRAGYTRST